MWELVTPLLIGTLTLMAWSLLYKENPFYHLAESLMIGWGMGYTLFVMVTTLDKTWFKPLSAGNWILVVPALVGLLLFTSFHRRYVFLSRWGMAAIAGAGTGFAVSRVVPVMIFGQIGGLGVPAAVDATKIANWVIILICTISVTIYFTFTREHAGFLGKVARIGRWSMMIAFGGTFGATLFANQVFVIERCAYLARSPQIFLIPIAIVILVVGLAKQKRKT